MQGSIRELGTVIRDGKQVKRWKITVDCGHDPETGRRRQQSVSLCGTLTQARDRRREMLNKVTAHGYTRTPHNLTVAAFLREWLANYVSNRSPRTHESYRFIAERHIIPEIGHLRLADLEPRQLQMLYTKKAASGLSSRTVRYVHSLMSQALAYGIKQRIIGYNVAIATDPPSLQKKRMVTLAPEHHDRFLDVAQQTPYFALFHLLLNTGLRRGEALALRWKHVDLGLESLGVAATVTVADSLTKVNGRVLVKEAKTAASRRCIPLLPNNALVMRQHKQQQQELTVALGGRFTDEQFVFCNTEGDPFDPSTVSKAFGNVIRKAGLPAMPLHGLRHTHATWLFAIGTHPKVVQERLGHSSIRETLDTYSHAVQGMQEAAILKLEQFLSEKRLQNSVSNPCPEERNLDVREG